MSLKLPSCLTEKHLTLFGVIVQWFARHELLMEQLMAHVAGTDNASPIALTRGLSLEGKRSALHDLLRHQPTWLDGATCRGQTYKAMNARKNGFA